MPGIHSATATAMPTDCAILFAALGDATRLQLVSRLCNSGPQSITRLAAGSEITRQAVTKHLKVMEAVGLVHSTRQGRESVWQLQQERLEAAQRYLGVISSQWDATLSRLCLFVEDT